MCQFEKLQCCGKSNRHQRHESILECIMSKSFDFTNESKFPVTIIVALTATVTILLWTGITILLKSDWSVFLIHPIYNSSIFILLMFLPLIISTRIRILRHEREELQQTLTTFTPILIGLQMNKDNSDYTKHLDAHISACLRDLGRAKFYDTVLYFCNLLISGYLALCASRAALLFSIGEMA